MHVCLTSDVIEGAPPLPAPPASKPNDLRDEVFLFWTLTKFAQKYGPGFRKVRDMEILTYYACEVTSGRRKIPVDVQKLIADWKAVIVTLCTAHDKDAIDAAEFKMDELLKPMLTAPVAQIREFYAGLLKALSDDKTVPFFIWSLFKGWGEMVLEKVDEKSPPKRLKKKLAEEVAEMALTKQTRKDMVDALVGALMWRSPQALKEIKADIESGATPRVRGRESCIFLVTEKGRGRNVQEKHCVML